MNSSRRLAASTAYMDVHKFSHTFLFQITTVLINSSSICCLHKVGDEKHELDTGGKESDDTSLPGNAAPRTAA